MGEYSIEVRCESFYLRGEDNFVRTGSRPCPPKCDVEGKHVHAVYDNVRQRHAITVYPKGDSRQGSVEILIEDIPKIRAALDQAEKVVTTGHD
jgi:hypothetical protein